MQCTLGACHRLLATYSSAGYIFVNPWLTTVIARILRKPLCADGLCGGALSGFFRVTFGLAYRDLVRQLTMGFDLVGCPVPDSRVYRPAPPTPQRMAECLEQLAEIQDPRAAADWVTSLRSMTIQ